MCVVSEHHFGPEHDSTMLMLSDVEQELHHLSVHHNVLHDPFCLYGDSAYAQSDFIVRAVPHALASPSVRLLNGYMSQIRVLVENLFCVVDQLWQLMNAKPSLKLGQSPLGMLFPVACLLFNCHTLLYGNQMGAHIPGALDMLVDDMTLETYLSL